MRVRTAIDHINSTVSSPAFSYKSSFRLRSVAGEFLSLGSIASARRDETTRGAAKSTGFDDNGKRGAIHTRKTREISNSGLRQLEIWTKPIRQGIKYAFNGPDVRLLPYVLRSYRCKGRPIILLDSPCGFGCRHRMRARKTTNVNTFAHCPYQFPSNLCADEWSVNDVQRPGYATASDM